MVGVAVVVGVAVAVAVVVGVVVGVAVVVVVGVAVGVVVGVAVVVVKLNNPRLAQKGNFVSQNQTEINQIVMTMARALCEYIEDAQDVYDDLSSKDRRHYKSMAKAALKASGLLERIRKVQYVTNIQRIDGNWNYDPYMHGYTNGLICAMSIITDSDPKYLKAPDKWLSDLPPLFDSTTNQTSAEG